MYENMKDDVRTLDRPSEGVRCSMEDGSSPWMADGEEAEEEFDGMFDELYDALSSKEKTAYETNRQKEKQDLEQMLAAMHTKMMASSKNVASTQLKKKKMIEAGQLKIDTQSDLEECATSSAGGGGFEALVSRFASECAAAALPPPHVACMAVCGACTNAET